MGFCEPKLWRRLYIYEQNFHKYNNEIAETIWAEWPYKSYGYLNGSLMQKSYI